MGRRDQRRRRKKIAEEAQAKQELARKKPQATKPKPELVSGVGEVLP